MLLLRRKSDSPSPRAGEDIPPAFARDGPRSKPKARLRVVKITKVLSGNCVFAAFWRRVTTYLLSGTLSRMLSIGSVRATNPILVLLILTQIYRAENRVLVMTVFGTDERFMLQTKQSGF